MAFCWGLIVALFALNIGLSEAQNNTTVPAPTTPGVPTLAPSTPTSPTSLPGGFYTFLIARFKTNTCQHADEDSMSSTFVRFYGYNRKFNLRSITSDLVKRDTCQFKFNFTFGPNLQMYNISEVFEDELKSINNTVDGMKLTNIEIKVHVDGITLGQFMVKADDCKKICCDGGGGNIKLTRNCEPSNKCRSYKLEKIESDCMKVCSKECSGDICKISLLVLLFGVFMNWFLK